MATCLVCWPPDLALSSVTPWLSHLVPHPFTQSVRKLNLRTRVPYRCLVLPLLLVVYKRDDVSCWSCIHWAASGACCCNQPSFHWTQDDVLDTPTSPLTSLAPSVRWSYRPIVVAFNTDSRCLYTRRALPTGIISILPRPISVTLTSRLNFFLV